MCFIRLYSRRAKNISESAVYCWETGQGTRLPVFRITCMKTRLRKADFLYPCIQTLILYSAIIETITLELLKVAKNLNHFFMYLSLTGLKS